MRPTFEILAMLPPLLYPNIYAGEEGPTRLCYAAEWLWDLKLIDKDEWSRAEDAILDALGNHVFLINHAKAIRVVSIDCTVRSPEYVAFRDKWLAELIEAHRLKEQRP